MPSPIETASLFPREALIGEGLSALSPLLIVGAVFAGLVYVTLRVIAAPNPTISSGTSIVRATADGDEPNGDDPGIHRDTNDDPTTRNETDSTLDTDDKTDQASAERRLFPATIVTLFTAAGCALLAGFVSPFALLALILALVVWIAVSQGWITTPLAAAAAAFLTIACAGGIAKFWSQWDEHDPKFDSVIVTRNEGREPITGFYITRSGGNVYVAVYPQATSRHLGRFAIVSVPDDQVTTIVIGPEYGLSRGSVHKPTPKLPITHTLTPKGKAISPVNSQPKSSEGNSGPQKANQPKSSIQPSVRVFALDELVPNSDHFCFPVGTMGTAETLRLTFSAPELGAAGTRFATPPAFELGQDANEVVTVHLPQLVRERLRAGRLLPIDVEIVAKANGNTVSTEYRLELLQPRGHRLRDTPCSRRIL
jgi:hypothetical protein